MSASTSSSSRSFTVGIRLRDSELHYFSLFCYFSLLQHFAFILTIWFLTVIYIVHTRIWII